MYFRDLFYDRGWVTVAETFLMFWSIAILVFKSVKLRRQRESMLFDLLPDSIGRDITVDNVGRFASGIRDLPVNPGSSFLVQRVLRGLEHFTVRRSASEVSTVLGVAVRVGQQRGQFQLRPVERVHLGDPDSGVHRHGARAGAGGRQSVGQPEGRHGHRKRQNGAGRDHRRLGRRVRYHVGGADHGAVPEVPGQFAAEGRGGPAELGGRVLQREPAETPAGRRRRRSCPMRTPWAR